MKFFSKLVAHKLFAWSAIIAVGVWLLVVPAFRENLGANPLENLLHRSGEIAIWTLGAVLSLTPLRVLFPNSGLVTALNRHRRLIGVSACVYGVIHFTLHLLYEGGWDAVVRSFSKPFIWLGASGLSILIVLALTSNQLSMRLLRRNWKRLHRFAYLAAAILLYHQAIAGKGHWRIGRWLVFSLATLQIARMGKTIIAERPRRPPKFGERGRPAIQPTLVATQ